MHLYQWYIVISAILIILEIFAAGFVLLPVGIAGLMTAVVAYFYPDLWLHAVFFICGSGLSILAINTFRERMDESAPPQAAGPVGQTGVIIDRHEGSNSLRVKIYGDVWDVVENSIPEHQISWYPTGTQVRVKSVIGNKVTIEKI